MLLKNQYFQIFRDASIHNLSILSPIWFKYFVSIQSSVANLSNFDDSLYIAKYSDYVNFFFLKHSHACQRQNKMHQCLHWLRHQYRTFNNWELPIKNSSAFRGIAPSCRYRISEAGVDAVFYPITQTAFLVFRINASDCDRPLHSGAAFDVFVTTEYQLQYCNVFDEYNYSYHIQCTMSIENVDVETNKYPSCFQLTVLLMYESHRAYQHWLQSSEPFRKVIYDNNTICVQNYRIISDTAVDGNISSNEIRKGQILVYSGFWKTIEIMKSFSLNSLLYSFHTPDSKKAKTNAIHTRRIMNYTNEVKLHPEYVASLVIHRNVTNNELKYVFSPVITVVERFSKFVTPQPVPIINVTNSDNIMEYYLIGESQMRYFALSLVEYFHGNLVHLFDTNSSKVDHFRWQNIQFNFSTYSNLMIENAESICNSKSARQPWTLILQSGSWDLSSFNAMIISQYQSPLVLEFFRKVENEFNFDVILLIYFALLYLRLTKTLVSVRVLCIYSG